ncbi:M20/M25/M40 family metallo-hydrolase [Kineococcus sp. SYSU DK018]|uniref:M20/M25/M40 family metallo-hydrolase n=1 Tax=Kineococcus sp. SYSU DK018 TaxID=3383139 RepID=UPI003D7E6D7A
MLPPDASRAALLEAARRYADGGGLLADLRRRVAHRTVSAPGGDTAPVREYYASEISPELRDLGARVRVLENPDPAGGPLLLAERHESDDVPTVLCYGHADVVAGQDGAWRSGLSPWELVVEGERWYGRGTADNKGQHTVNLAALRLVLTQRGRLGFNLRFLLESSEEIGSRGLARFAAEHAADLAADVFIGSDGPRLHAGTPTLFLGARGGLDIDLVVDLRDGSYHSGNWGGYLRNPATTLAAAVATLVDGRGRVLVPALLPAALPDEVRADLRGVAVGTDPADPAGDPTWGDPELTPAERVYGWNALEVLSMSAGDPQRPVNAIPGRATARLQLRFVVGTDVPGIPAALRAHLDRHGFSCVDVHVSEGFPAGRADRSSPWVRWAEDSLRRSGADPVVLPNIGGSLPSHVFSDVLGVPTVWLPHSHPGSRQHGPDEHLLAGVAREGLVLAAGLFHDLGEPALRPEPAAGARAPR